MALTPEEIDAFVHDLNDSFFDMMGAVAEALRDDPNTPQDEGSFSAEEIMMLSAQGLLVTTQLRRRVKGMSGEDWAEVMAAWSAKAGLT